ncbi:MAG: Gfo/Idh/MocA family protein [Planctomycetota bacterium]|jgi:predicted dehydrogenase
MSRNDELSVPDAVRFEAPELPYRPPILARRPRIALVGCGGIARVHLRAYADAGYDVVALHSRTRKSAEACREAFFPEARVCDSVAELLAVEGLDVVDLTPHPSDRAPLIEAAIDAGIPALSQKPLALDLEVARRLVERAEAAGVPLAVNQNGRFAPHLAWAREAVRAGLLGEIHTVRVSIQWDHNWVVGTAFDQDPDLVLRDFGIHWFDLVAALVVSDPVEVEASVFRTPSQMARPPLSASVRIRFADAQASLDFDGDSRWGPQDATTVLGTRGTLRCSGPSLEDQRVVLATEAGFCEPRLEGSWFPGAFHGAMAEFLDAVWTGREPIHSARQNLRSLELCERALSALR